MKARERKLLISADRGFSATHSLKNDTKTFDELTFEEQSKAMNMLALQFRKQLDAHLRRAGEEGRDGTQILDTRLTLLRSILDDYVGQLPQIPVIDIRVVD